MSPRFGTDGVRGEAFTYLTESYVRALGAAATTTFGTERLLIGRDTRESGPALMRAFAEGCAVAGASIDDLGVVPTPAVAHMSAVHGIPAAMLSASHNPWADNGIKLFAAGGRKLTDADQALIEGSVLAHADVAPIEPSMGHVSIEPYIQAVIDSVGGRRFDATRVVLDCANGSAATTARAIFETLGADVVAIADQPTGRNINDGVGSTHPENLVAAVEQHGAAVGFAFDGDADRVIACGPDGQLIDGDRILAMGAIDRRDTGRLPHDTVVGTVMSNLGFRRAMQREGIEMVETAVGDRHVLEALDAGGYLLGGEQSGHIIHRDLATTGDGVLTAVQLLDAALRRGLAVGEWSASVMTSYPQVLENVRVTEAKPGFVDGLEGAIAAEQASLGDDGRILVRASGTEPVIRVMVEASEQSTAAAVASRLADAVRLQAHPPSTD
ncbi:MAG: phosphoglucosamine mutase [Acidimicrobiales bacterium]